MTQKLPRERVKAELAPVYKCLKETVSKLQLMLIDADIWESTDAERLLALSERLVDTIEDAHNHTTNLYDWIHNAVGRSPGLSRPMGL